MRAGANVPGSEIHTLFPAEPVLDGTRELVVTTQLIGKVSAVIIEVAHEFPVDALFIGTSVLCGPTRSDSGRGTRSDIVLIGRQSIVAIVAAVAELIARDAFVVCALEAIHFVAGKVGAEGWGFVLYLI